MENFTVKQLKRLPFEDFPLMLFFRLMQKPQGVPERFLGARKWEHLVQKWEEFDDSADAQELLEEEKRTLLPLMQAQKATAVLEWLPRTPRDVQPILEELGLPWDPDPETMVKQIADFAQSSYSKYENNQIQLEAVKKRIRDKEKNTNFTIQDSIATLNLAGFTIHNPKTLTIGQYMAMNKAIERNGKRPT